MARPRRRGPRGCTNNCAVCPGPVLERPKCALGVHHGHCLCLEHALERSRSTPMPDPQPVSAAIFAASRRAVNHEPSCASFVIGHDFAAPCDCGRAQAPTLSAAEVAASRQSPAPWCPDCLGSGKTGTISELVRPRGDAPSCQRCQGRGTLGPVLMEDINGNTSVGNMPSRDVIMGTNEVDRGVHARISDAMRAAAGLRVPPASHEGDDVLPGGVRLSDLFANSRSRAGQRTNGPRSTIEDRMRIRDEQLATGRAPQVTTWRTQDGREIPIATMEDTHLHNTIRYLERKVAEARAPALLRLATDRERAEEIRRLATAAFSSYAALAAEAKRRELGPTLGTDMADLEDKIAAEQRAASETDAAARMRLVAEEMGQGPKKDGK